MVKQTEEVVADNAAAAAAYQAVFKFLTDQKLALTLVAYKSECKKRKIIVAPISTVDLTLAVQQYVLSDSMKTQYIHQ